MRAFLASHAGRRPRLLAALVSLSVTATVLTSPSGAAETPVTASLNVDIQATDGVGTSRHPGRSCAEGGSGAYWHFDYGAKLAPAVFSSLPGDIRAHLDLHSNVVRFPNSTDAYAPPPPGATAFLQGDESHASLLNQRGSLKLRMTSGRCDEPKLSFDGSVATGGGEWAVASDEGAGAYRQATGNGKFTLRAEVNPGADNALALALTGNIQVLQPSLQVEAVDTYWGGLGIDYLTRRVTVLYKVTNSGPGDSFGARMVSATSTTDGVKALGPQDQPLGDLLCPPDDPPPDDPPCKGDTQLFKVRYELDLEKPPCEHVILGCAFHTRVTVRLPDALDVAKDYESEVIPVKAPDLPPPLSDVRVT